MRYLLFLVAVGAFGQGSSYRWIRQLGGSGQETAVGVAVDASGNTYVAGSTDSSDFPVKNAVQSRPGGAPLYRVDAAGAVGLYGTGVSSILGVAVSSCCRRTVYAVSPQLLLRSADLGETWSSTPLPSGITPTSVAVACDQPGAPTVFVSSAQGLFRSRDLTNWNTISPGNLAVGRVLVDPNVPATVYARTPQGLARSEDSGDSWQFPGAYTYDLSFDPRTPGTMYAPVVYFVDNTLAVSAILPAKSVDFGRTWSPMAALPYRDNTPHYVFADPVKRDLIYTAGNYGFFVSSDAGQTWTAKTVSLGSLGVAPPVAVDFEAGIVYAKENSRVVATRDGFDTVTPVTPVVPLLNSLAVSAGLLFASADTPKDVFVTKLNPDGEVIFSTYFGGASEDTATAMAVGGDGAVYLTGSTASLDFPTTPGAFQPGASSPGAKFLFKLNPDGNLAWSTYFSGTSDSKTTAQALAVDADGSAILSGTTSGGLPVTPGAYQTQFSGTFGGTGGYVPLPSSTNAFAAKFRPDASALRFCTYLGSQSEMGTVLVLAPDGSMYTGGGQKIFHLSADGSNLLGSAATGESPLAAMTMDGSGFLYTASSAQTGGGAILTRRTADLEVVARSSLAGAGSVTARFDGSGNLLLAGSATPYLPTVAPLQGPFAPQTGFLSVLAPDFSRTLFSTFAGDRHLFSVAGAAPAPDGAIIFSGSTRPSSGFAYGPFPPGPNDAGSTDVFVAKLTTRIPALRLDSIVNAASFVANPLAANEALAVRGQGFGADARVLVDGAPAAILSRAPDQLIVKLPMDFRKDGAAQVEIDSGGARSNPVLMPVAVGSPGVFSVDGSGAGQGYILNADATRNGASNPAAEGETITIYLTGANREVPVAVYLYAFYAGVTAVSIGPVDGLPGDVYQVSVRVPVAADLAAQNPDLKGFRFPPVIPVQVVIDGVSSRGDITMSLK